MKISIIIPAHNEEASIAAAIEAVLAQDYSDKEIIVVDNNSTDRTMEVAQKFPVTVVEEKNKGTMFACERGRREAHGEIIARLDADCLPEEDWLSRGARFFANPKVVGVSGPYSYYDASAFFRFSSGLIQNTLYPFMSLVARLFGKGGIMIGGNSLMRATALEKIGGFNTAITFYGDDTDTAVRLGGQGKIIFSLKLPMKTSARRFGNEGVIRISLLYVYHFFRRAFFS